MSLALFGFIAIDGLAAWQLDAAEASQVSSYLAVGQRIDAALVPGGMLLGPERWWWPLHAHSYRSLRAIWFRWAEEQRSGPPPNLDAMLEEVGATNIIVNNNVRADILAFPEALQQQFWAFMEQCATQVDVVDDPTYLQIKIYEVRCRSA